MNGLKRWIIRREAEKFVDNAIKESNMSLAMKTWLTGLANAGISGLAVVAGTQAAGTTWKQTFMALGIPVGISLLKWVTQHPIPDPSKIQESLETAQVATKAASTAISEAQAQTKEKP